jgi:hypothetical protein
MRPASGQWADSPEGDLRKGAKPQRRKKEKAKESNIIGSEVTKIVVDAATNRPKRIQPMAVGRIGNPSGNRGRTGGERLTGRWMTGTFSCRRFSCHLKTDHDDLDVFSLRRDPKAKQNFRQQVKRFIRPGAPRVAQGDPRLMAWTTPGDGMVRPAVNVSLPEFYRERPPWRFERRGTGQSPSESGFGRGSATPRVSSSRSDGGMVAVGFNPREMSEHRTCVAWRRLRFQPLLRDETWSFVPKTVG